MVKLMQFPAKINSHVIITAQDYIEPAERDLFYNFAPGEGNQPVNIFLENGKWQWRTSNFIQKDQVR